MKLIRKLLSLAAVLLRFTLPVLAEEPEKTAAEVSEPPTLTWWMPVITLGIFGIGLAITFLCRNRIKRKYFKE